MKKIKPQLPSEPSIPKSSICESEGCDDKAAWHPTIIMRDSDGKILLEGDTHTVVCNDHKEGINVDTFMTDAQYEMLCKSFKALKKPCPPRDKMELVFNEL